MMLRGHNSITSTGRAAHPRVEQRPFWCASFVLNTCPKTPINSSMQLEGFSIRSLKSAQRQDSLGMR